MKTNNYKILNFAAVSGTNIGDNLISQMIPYLSRKLITACDTRGKLVKKGQPQNFLDGNISEFRKISHYIPHKIKRIIIKLIAKRRHDKLAEIFDEVWIGGGNLLFDKGCDNLEMSLSIARSFNYAGKKVQVISVGVGPFVNNPAKSLCEIAQIAEKITVRDHSSRTLLSSLNISSEVLIDPVWFLSDYFREKWDVDFGGKRSIGEFGLNVMHPRVLGLTVDYEEWLDGITENVVLISRVTGLRPLLIISSYDDDDPKVAQDLRIALRQRMQDPVNSVLLPSDISTKDDIEKFSNLDFVLTHRMHVAISSLALNIRTLVFPWQKKIPGVLASVYGDLTDFMLLKQSTFLIDEVLSKIDQLDGLQLALERNLNAAKEKYRLRYENT